VRTLSRFAMLILVAAQTAPVTTSSITGIVSRAGSAEALDQAVVSLIPAAGIAAPPTVETDATGRFNFRNVPPGRYAIRAGREGYFGPLLHGASQPFVSRLITLSEGQSIQDLHLDLIPGATVSGRVFDERGVPVPAADVSAVRITYDHGRRFLTPMGRRADERGEYRLYWLAPGEYYIRADLAPGLASGSDGTSRTTYFPNAADLDTAQPIVLGGGAERTALDIGLRTTPAATIRGKIINNLPDSKNHGVGFSLVPQDPNIPFFMVQLASSLVNVETGDFELRGVRPGSYELVVRTNNSRGFAGEGHVPVEVGSGDLDGVIVAVQPPVDVKIRLLMEGGTSIDLRTLEFFLDQRERGVFRLRPSQPIGSNGVVTFSNVPPSMWAPVIFGPYPDAYVSDMRQRGKSVFNDGIIRVEAEPESVELIVNAKGPAIEGIVRGAARSGIDTTRVVLVPQPPRRKNVTLYQVTNPDSTGHFRFTGVAPGEYKVFAWESVPANAWENSGFMAPFEGFGRVVSVNSGDLANVTVNLIGANQR
jgi:Carboxypeptidase regulatory-like domain